jgi:hypothetical protein
MGVIKSNGHRFMLELDGEQHFRPVKRYGGSMSKLRDQICRDLAKNKYAADNDMSLLRIAYSDRIQMEKWIREFIDYCCSTTTPTVVFSNPELYRKTAEIVQPHN